jgi:hypothetical protein
VSTLHMSVLGAHWASTPVSEDALWSFCFGGIADRVPIPERATAKPRRAARVRP